MGKFEDLINAFMELRRSSEYDDSQARADDGKWTDDGGSHQKKMAIMDRARRLGYKSVSFGKDGQVIANGKKVALWVKGDQVVDKTGKPAMGFKDI